MPWSPVQVAWALLVVFVAALVQGSVGMGLGLVSVPFLLMIDPVFVPGPVLASGIVLNVLMVWRERQAMAPSSVTWGVAGRAIGTVVTSVTLAQLPQDQTTAAISVSILVAVGLSLSGLHIEPTAWALLGAGTVSGVVGTLASVGGPPMALLLQKRSGPELRATMGGFFIFGTLISLAGLAYAGRFGAAEAQASLLFLPAIVVGYLASGPLASVLDRGHTRTGVLLVSAASAAVLLARTLG